MARPDLDSSPQGASFAADEAAKVSWDLGRVRVVGFRQPLECSKLVSNQRAEYKLDFHCCIGGRQQVGFCRRRFIRIGSPVRTDLYFYELRGNLDGTNQCTHHELAVGCHFCRREQDDCGGGLKIFFGGCGQRDFYVRRFRYDVDFQWPSTNILAVSCFVSRRPDTPGWRT